MKRIAWMVGTSLLLAATLATAQSLADVARAARKSKAQQNTSVKYFDNDNLPTDTKLSIVGPPPANDTKDTANSSASSGNSADAKKDSGGSGSATPAAGGSAPANSKASEDAVKAKIEAQKQKIDSLAKDLDLTEREYRLRAVEMYSDAGNRLRNAAQWDQDEARYKKDIADKQAAVDAAKQELKDLEEQERSGEAPTDKK